MNNPTSIKYFTTKSSSICTTVTPPPLEYKQKYEHDEFQTNFMMLVCYMTGAAMQI